MKTAISAPGHALPEQGIVHQIGEAYPNEKAVDFYTSRSDSGHIIVSRFLYDGHKEIIGHVYVEVDGDEIKYYCTNRRGREIFPPTTDFNQVEMKYERFVQLLALRKRTQQFNKNPLNINNFNLKNSNIMKTQIQNPEEKQRKINQLVFVEYQNPAGDGHLVTIVDSYRNVIGRIHRNYNTETKKYEFQAYDHAGSPLEKSDKLWQAKNEFVDKSRQLLEDAYQRRLESKEKAKAESVEKPDQEKQTKKFDERRTATNLRQDKAEIHKSKAESSRENINDRPTENVRSTQRGNDRAGRQSRQDERETQLNDIRDAHGEDREEMDLDR